MTRQPGSEAPTDPCSSPTCDPANNARRGSIMFRRRTLTRTIAATTAIGVIGTAAAPIAATQAHQISDHSAAPQEVNVQLWLSPKLAAAQRFATAVSTPGSATYRNYLTPDTYANRFGATPREIKTVTSWMRAHGFKDVTSDPQRDYVAGTGKASNIKATFGANLI